MRLDLEAGTTQPSCSSGLRKRKVTRSRQICGEALPIDAVMRRGSARPEVLQAGCEAISGVDMHPYLCTTSDPIR